MLKHEMICSLICKQMRNATTVTISVQSRAATAVEHCREASDRGGELRRLGPVLSRLLDEHDVHRNLVTVWRRQARTGVLAFGPGPMQRQDDEVRFAAVSLAPDRQPLTASSETCGAIEVEFADGARMRITGATDGATLTAVMAAPTQGRAR